MEPTIQSEEGRFFVEQEGESIAEITYVTEQDGSLTIDHTLVSEQLRGQSIGEQLVKKVVDKARTEGVKITPVCSYAAHQFEKHAEYKDVLKT
ncbi:putative GNAT family acetyltransferase [Paenibacillus shirakamiensis]|uniref:GNAT family acetyltransferase n=1 Tax=Paenibacillus shirakamiensis TaxID=1265935 RepID=A0ABS4JJ39_9BACL|nr:GNAT family N-acetyltransferase [Paenibacillus shirakamiensis]MBP2001720.1 putative GNAT family acetyltransferase [Paenibacillus shirakamiensis]